MFSRTQYVNPFAPKCHFVPAQIEQPEYDDPDQSPIVTPIKKEKKPRYLPGERLLKKINKANVKPKEEIDIEKINRSLSNIMREF